jgi:plasmid stabilization system protein ParE
VKLSYTSRAKDDVELAFVWYERQRKGLGYDFLDCVEASVQLILANPKMYQVYHSCFHGCVLRRFPFSIFYTIEDKEIVIHSVFDSRQNPGKRP